MKVSPRNNLLFHVSFSGHLNAWVPRGYGSQLQTDLPVYLSWDKHRPKRIENFCTVLGSHVP